MPGIDHEIAPVLSPPYEWPPRRGGGSARARPKASPGRSLWSPVFTIAIMGSSLVDLPRQLTLGPITGLGLLTVAWGVLAWLLWLIQPISTRALPRPGWPLLTFVAWAALSLVLNEPTLNGPQNVMVISAFVGMCCFAFRAAQAPVGRRRECSDGVPMGILERDGRLCAAARVRRPWRDFHHGSSRLRPVRNPCDGAIPGGLALRRKAGHLPNRGADRADWIEYVAARAGGWAATGPLLAAAEQGKEGWLRAMAWATVIVLCAQASLLYLEPLRDRFFEGDISLRVGGSRSTGPVGLSSGTLSGSRTKSLPGLAKAPFR